MSYTSIQEAQAGIMTVMGDMPEDIRNGVITELSSPVMIEALVMTGEYLYARREDLPEGPVRNAAADFVEFRTANGFWGAWDDNRGTRMVEAIRRGTVEEGDPELLQKFLPGALAPEMPTPPGGVAVEDKPLALEAPTK